MLRKTMDKKIILLALLICLCFSGSFGQDNSVDLKAKKITLKLKDKPLWLVFQHLMVKYDVPIGLEGSTLDNGNADYAFNTNLPYINPNSKIIDGNYVIKNNLLNIDVENASLETVLDEIVRQMKNYKWEINDDVVNIIPTKGRDERNEKLLALNISSFSFQKNFSIGQIRNNILDLPEIQTFLSEQKIFSTKWRAFVASATRRLPVEMKFSNLTLRDLLNKITKIKRGGWLLRQSYLYGTAEKEYIEIDI
jgi:hypothetical protein